MNRLKSNNFLTFLLLGVVLVGFTACASSPQERTGFLSDYSKLKKNPNFDGSYIYINRNLPLRNYSKFIINPVQVRLTKEGRDREVDRSKLIELSKYTRKIIAIELKKSGYDIVRNPGPGTMTIRLALTDVKPAKIALNIHPGTIIFGMGLGGASGEAEFIDSVTGEVIAAAIESQKGERGFDGLTKYGNTENVVERWAKRLALRMDKAHGRIRE